MKFDEVAILLACHTFHDFPVHFTGDDADRLLAAWTSLWHPLLIHRSGKMPGWYRVDTLPPADRPRLFVLPTCHRHEMATGLPEQVTTCGGRLIQDGRTRQEILAQACQDWADPHSVDTELAADFMALGYAYLQIELLTKKMRYSTRVLETAFADNLVSAAGEAVAGHADAARQLLHSCYDFLSQERDHYYAVDVYLVDVSLLAPALLGAPLRDQLSTTAKTNLLLPAELLETLRTQHPENVAAVREAIEAQQAALIGGEQTELAASLVSLAALDRLLQLGLADYQRTFQHRPHVYGRRTFGLTTALPQLLVHHGFAGALHATFDGGRFPEATQAKSRWEGDGQFNLDAMMRAPLDASRPETFLNLATKLGETMDMDHIATRAFVHWAGQASVWYADLQRVTRFTKSLGKFVTVDEYFRDTYDPGIHERCEAHHYHSPYFEQQVVAQATRTISQWSAYWRHTLWLQSWHNLAAMSALVHPDASTRAQFDEARTQLDRFTADPWNACWPTELATLPDRLTTLCHTFARQVGLLGAASQAKATDGYLFVNPWCFPRRIWSEANLASLPVETPVYAADSATSRVALDLPACGVSLLTNRGKPASRKKPEPPLAETHLLRNEFMEVKIDPATGGIRSLKEYASRTNRISQQLALHQPSGGFRPLGPGGAPIDGKMIAEQITVQTSDSIVGVIQSRGRLVGDQEATQAEFVQTMTLRRGSRVVELDIELTPHVNFHDDPWESYLGCRFAWSNEAADLSRGVNDHRRPTGTRRIESPLFLEIDDGQQRTAILAGGLPFHRRLGARMLDTLLIVKHESSRQFRLGLGLDLKQPFREALSFLSPTIGGPVAGITSASPSAWFFHVDARNVFAHQWSPIWDGDTLLGVTFLLSEQDGRSGAVKLRSFRSIASAKKVDGGGQTIDACHVVDDTIEFRVAPFEWVKLEAMFAGGQPRETTA